LRGVAAGFDGQVHGPRVERPVLERAADQDDGRHPPDRSNAIVVPSREVTVSAPDARDHLTGVNDREYLTSDV
jgi:hypothetical protein